MMRFLWQQCFSLLFINLLISEHKVKPSTLSISSLLTSTVFIKCQHGGRIKCEYTRIRPLYTEPFASIHLETEEKKEKKTVPSPPNLSCDVMEKRAQIEKWFILFHKSRGNDKGILQ